LGLRLLKHFLESADISKIVIHVPRIRTIEKQIVDTKRQDGYLNAPIPATMIVQKS